MPFYETQTLRVSPGAWSGNPVFSYQWLRDGQPIGGVPLAFTTHPDDVSVTEPEGAQFTVVAVGNGTLTYQWQVLDAGPEWEDIPNATGSTYTIGLTDASLDGNWYRCAVSDDVGGPIYSNTAELTVAPLGDYDQIVTGDQPGGFTVPENEVWKIDGDVTTDDNVVVHGTLVMQPGASLTFEDVDNDAFLGAQGQGAAGFGAHDVVTPDTGLWVMMTGTLDARGTPKTSWLRAAGDIAEGATEITLEEAPTGWNVGDEIVIAPTRSVPKIHLAGQQAYLVPEERTITAIDGATVTVGVALAEPHPSYTFHDGAVFTAEVLNITRDVNINGTPTGRPHVMLMCQRPIQMSHVGMDYVGPRGLNDERLIARWALHLHKLGDASRGSLFEGLVIRRSDTQSYVPHGSHGVRLQDCIAHDCTNGTFWWDPPGGTLVKLTGDAYYNADDRSDDNVWDRCVSSHSVGRKAGGAHHGHTAFGMIQGVRGGVNTISNCVSFGTYAPGTTNMGAGFGWAQDLDSKWDVFDCVSHHDNQGFFFWTNISIDPPQLTDGFRSYRCLRETLNGAYLHNSIYDDIHIEVELDAALDPHAGPSSFPPPLQWANSTFKGGAGHSAVRHHIHLTAPRNPQEFNSCTFVPGGGAPGAIEVKAFPSGGGIDNSRHYAHNHFRVTDGTFDLPSGVPEFYFENDVRDQCIAIWDIDEETTYHLRRHDYPLGVYNSSYNAKVVTPRATPSLDAAIGVWTPMEIQREVDGGVSAVRHISAMPKRHPMVLHNGPAVASDGTYRLLQFRNNQYAMAGKNDHVFGAHSYAFTMVLVVKFTTTAGSETLFTSDPNGGRLAKLTRQGTSIVGTFNRLRGAEVNITAVDAVGTSDIHVIALRRNRATQTLSVIVDDETHDVSIVDPRDSDSYGGTRMTFGGDYAAGGGNHDFYGAAWHTDRTPDGVWTTAPSWSDSHIATVAAELLDYTRL